MSMEYAKFIGALVIGRFIFSLLRGLYIAFVRSGKKMRKYGQWAVVTGATDGIGKAIAAEMVGEGMNVIIVARTQQKLDDTKSELDALAKKKSKDVTIETLCVDYTEFGGPQTDAYKRVVKALEGKDVGVLVNNVGIGYEFPMWFHELDDSQVSTLLKMNIDSVVYMTRIVLQGMVQRKRGAILNISSASGLTPAPLLTLYGATKCFVDKFSRDMDAEYSVKYNIHVQSQAPLWIATKLASVRREKATVATPLPEVYAKSAMKRIGYGPSNAGYWVHDAVVCGVVLLKSWGLTEMLNGVVLKMHAGIRKAGLKKRERKAAEEEAMKAK